MGNVPVVHEVVTSVESLGDAITGNPERASQRWENYSKESVLGSGVMAATHAAKGDMQKASEYGKGMGRATGQAIAGGGLLKDVPVFQELATAGKSLGDSMAGDAESASKRWTHEYVQKSCIGSGVKAAIEDGKGSGLGDYYRSQCGKAWQSAGVAVAETGVAVAVGVGTDGVGLGVAVAAEGPGPQKRKAMKLIAETSRLAKVAKAAAMP